MIEVVYYVHEGSMAGRIYDQVGCYNWAKVDVIYNWKILSVYILVVGQGKQTRIELVGYT